MCIFLLCLEKKKHPKPLTSYSVLLLFVMEYLFNPTQVNLLQVIMCRTTSYFYLILIILFEIIFNYSSHQWQLPNHLLFTFHVSECQPSETLVLFYMTRGSVVPSFKWYTDGVKAAICKPNGLQTRSIEPEPKCESTFIVSSENTLR